MKAIQIKAYGGPEVLELVDMPKPEVKPGTVLVKVHGIGVGRPDILHRTGVYKWKPPLPAVVGGEAAGYVEAVGAGVDDVAEGDPVLVLYAQLGCYAEYVLAPVKNLVRLPPDISMDVALHVPNYVTAEGLLSDAARGIEASALYVNGAAGGVGVALTQLARLRGITVIAGTGSEEKCAFALEHGASHAINYSTTDVVPEVLRLTQGRGVELMFDHLIGPRFTDNLDMIAPLGMAVSFNALQGFPAEDLFAQMRARLTRSLAVRCFSAHVYDDKPERFREILTKVAGLLSDGSIRPPVSAKLPLSQARKAHEQLEARAVVGKLLLTP